MPPKLSLLAMAEEMEANGELDDDDMELDDSFKVNALALLGIVARQIRSYAGRRPYGAKIQRARTQLAKTFFQGVITPKVKIRPMLREDPKWGENTPRDVVAQAQKPGSSGKQDIFIRLNL